MIDLAYISPLNPIASGLSDYSEMLVPALAEHARITLYSDCGTPSNQEIADRFTVRPIAHLARHRSQHDLRLYQFGNSPDHRNAFDAFRRMPGVVTLHEPFLHHGFYGMSEAYYYRETYYDGVSARGRVKFLIQRLIEDDRDELRQVLCIGRLIDASLGLVVHSQTARRIIDQYHQARAPHSRRSGVAVAVIPQSMPVAEMSRPREHRAEFGLPADALIFGVAGTVHPSKEPHLVIEAFARVAAEQPDARLVFIGDLLPDSDLPALIRDLNVADRVTFFERLEPLERMHRAIAACDVIINLRRPTIGETSATALRALALGRPLIVRDVGWYGELPDVACSKISPDAGLEELARAITELGRSAARREQMGQTGRAFAQAECNPATVARCYAEFLEDVRDRLSRRAEP